jgi:ribose 5-phosphate isomerase B
LENGRLAIAIGSDHAGFALKETIRGGLEKAGYAVEDLGTPSEESCDYPDFALPVAEAVSSGRADRGILICGTGAGMAMTANKVSGIRAAVCNELYTAEYCRLHNDANILALGARIVSEEDAMVIVEKFLSTAFEADDSRHVRRLGKFDAVERKYMKA